MASRLSNFENQGPCEHLVKGTAWSCATLATAIGVATIAIGVVTLATTLILWDGLFIYKWTIVNPLHLFWAIPVTIAFVALDIAIICSIGIFATKIIKSLSLFANETGENALNHFRALCRAPAIRLA